MVCILICTTTACNNKVGDVISDKSLDIFIHSSKKKLSITLSTHLCNRTFFLFSASPKSQHVFANINANASVHLVMSSSVFFFSPVIGTLIKGCHFADVRKLDNFELKHLKKLRLARASKRARARVLSNR